MSKEQFMVTLELTRNWSIEADDEDEALEIAKNLYESDPNEALQLADEDWEVC